MRSPDEATPGGRPLRYFVMDTPATAKADTRRAPRFALEQVVSIRSLEGRFEDASGISRDVSACGVFVYVDEALPVGASVELLMMMPTIHSLSESIFPLRCLGAVVRVAPQQGRYGVAVQFEKIDVIAEC
jgi:PilZ domain